MGRPDLRIRSGEVVDADVVLLVNADQQTGIGLEREMVDAMCRSQREGKLNGRRPEKMNGSEGGAYGEESSDGLKGHDGDLTW